MDPTQQTVMEERTEMYGEFKPGTTLSGGNDLATYMDVHSPKNGRRTIVIRVDDNTRIPEETLRERGATVATNRTVKLSQFELD